MKALLIPNQADYFHTKKYGAYIPFKTFFFFRVNGFQTSHFLISYTDISDDV